jgi:heme exporter protein CcmD
MDGWSEFIAMSGYATWVWSAWGLSLAVLLGLEWSSRRQLAMAVQRARRAAGPSEEEGA